MRSARTRRCSASSRRKPRSRNTLPVEGVTLSFMVHLTSCQVAGSAKRDQCLIPLPGELQVVLRRFLRPLLEGMEHVDCLRKLGDVAHPVFQRGMNPDLTNPRPNARHRFPVERFQPLLNLTELKACE